MSEFWNFLTVAAVCATVAVIVVLILLSLPQSRLRTYLLEVFGWGASALSAASIVSPIDAIPDFIPVAGQMDDLAALFVLATGVATALWSRSQRKTLPAPAKRLKP